MFDFLVGNDLLSSLWAFALVLIPAVIIHELGHLFAAKAVGITILEFGVGYPPRLFKLFRWGETEFTFNLLPLGGFVRPFGEDMIRPQSAEEVAQERAKLNAVGNVEADSVEQTAPDSDRERLLRLGITNPRTVNEIKPMGRILFMAAGAIANIAGAFVVFVIIGLMGIPQQVGMTAYIATLAPDSVLAQAGLQIGDTVNTINGESFEGAKALYHALNTDQVLTLGVLRDVTPDDTEMSVTQLEISVTPGIVEGGTLISPEKIIVTGNQPGSPAEIAGFQPGDILLSADGQSLLNEDGFETLRDVNEASQGRAYTLKLERGGETLSLQVTPRLNPQANEGYLGASIANVGVAEAWDVGAANHQSVRVYTPLAFVDALGYGANQVGSVLQQIAQMPARLLSGDAQPEESRVVSIVGISQLGGVLLQDSVNDGNLYPFLQFAALISIALGVTNLLPIPPLDGGRILFVLIEMVRGKPLSQRLEDAIMMTGILLMLVLGVVFIINDIRDPIINMLR